MGERSLNFGYQVAPASLELRASRQLAAEAPGHERERVGKPGRGEQAELPPTNIAKEALGQELVEFPLNQEEGLAAQPAYPAYPAGDPRKLLHACLDPAECARTVGPSANNAHKEFEFQRLM